MKLEFVMSHHNLKKNENNFGRFHIPSKTKLQRESHTRRDELS